MKVSFPTEQNAPRSQEFNAYNPALYGIKTPYHKGIDFSVQVGTPVYSCMDGIVEVATVLKKGYGRHIRIRHLDDSLSIYGHLSSISVSVGDNVISGQEIGKSGGDRNDKIDGDGNTTGAHLHWEIRPSGKTDSDQNAVNPMEYCLKYIDNTYTVAKINAYSGLNVRTEPNPKSRVLYTLTNSELVKIIEIKNGWGKILSLRPEWTNIMFLTFTGEEGENSPIIDIGIPNPPITIEQRVTVLENNYNKLIEKLNIKL